MDWKMSMFPLIVTGGFVAHGKRPQLLRKNGLHRTTGKVRHVKIFGTVAGCVLGRVRRAAKWGRLHGAHLPGRCAKNRFSLEVICPPIMFRMVLSGKLK